MSYKEIEHVLIKLPFFFLPAKNTTYLVQENIRKTRLLYTRNFQPQFDQFKTLPHNNTSRASSRRVVPRPLYNAIKSKTTFGHERSSLSKTRRPKALHISHQSAGRIFVIYARNPIYRRRPRGVSRVLINGIHFITLRHNSSSSSCDGVIGAIGRIYIWYREREYVE